MSETGARRRSPWLRWLGVGLRGLHLAMVVALGAALLGAPLSVYVQSLGVLVSGIALLGIDLRSRPNMLWEWSGVSLAIKLAVVAWMALDATWRLPLFWVLVLWSAVFAHAPASFRHAVWRSR